MNERKASAAFVALQKGGDKLGYESEAFAIYDTMKYIKPEVHTLCVGTAFGESAMLLSAGTPVRRQSMRSVLSAPHACSHVHSEGSLRMLHGLCDGRSGCAGEAGGPALVDHHAAAAHAAVHADAGVGHRHLQERAAEDQERDCERAIVLSSFTLPCVG